jgi:hypothetical protein
LLDGLLIELPWFEIGVWKNGYGKM